MSTLHKHNGIAVALVATLGIAACGPTASDDSSSDKDIVINDPVETNTVVDVAVANGSFTTLVGALQATGLDQALSGPGPFTVFAPTDDAFALLPEGLVAGLDSDTLSAILQYHVVADELNASEVVAASTASTLAGGDVSISVDGQTVVLDGRVQVTQTDIMADNGVIHVIDAVLIPGAFPGDNVQALSAYPRFSSLVGAVAGAGLAGTLADGSGDGFTIFAPTNSAFSMVDLSGLSAQQIADTLTYHVVSGQLSAADVVALPSARTVEGSAIAIDASDGVTLNGSSMITYTDFETSNGVIHVIDQVLSIRSTVVDQAIAAGSFTTLAGALSATGLAAALDGNGPFTVFAPTDDAFDLLPAGLIDSLSAEQLSDILLYHVAGAELMAADVMMADGASALSGGSIDIAVKDGTVVIDGRVQVTQTDITADNGVIHVIDAVMIDGAFPGTVVDALIASPRFSDLVGAVVSADLAGALSSAPDLTVFAPTNDGFMRLPEGLVAGLDTPTLSAILQYHVLGSRVDAAGAVAAAGSPDANVGTLLGETINLGVDQTVVINGRAQVEYADIHASNGVIHAIDSVYLPVDFPGTVVQALAAYPRFDTLVSAVAGQGLADALSDTSGAGFTVFAPTESAFAPVDLGALTSEQLTGVLLYHVLGSTAPAADVVTLDSATTLQGSQISIDTSMGVMLDGAVNVTFTDFHAANGVIHVIDGVLLP